MILGRHTCKSDLITFGKYLIYHSILNYALRQTYLYLYFDRTWQELNLSSILTYALRHTYLFK
jgi:hypothetical protein